ncbi:M28 family peptidase [Saprospiraceae bacterium]|nr:M28 family peptidase [Saprospiraceae bacterium]
MMKFVALIIILCLSQNSNAQNVNDLLELQKDIVSKLSGHQALDKGIVLSSRSTRKERQIARVFLSELISTIDLNPEYQSYSLPNENALLDLFFQPFKGANVFTTLASTNPSDEYVVIGAHYDTERDCPGAIDNASGIAICFGVLKKLAALPERNMNVILVYFDQEEEFLCGSQAFAKMLVTKNFKIHSVHTLDMMGWDRDGDSAVELGLPSELLQELYTAAGEKLGIPVITTRVNASDDYSFWELGFNKTGISDEITNGDLPPYKDTPKDTYETVNFDYINTSTDLIFEVLKEIVK